MTGLKTNLKGKIGRGRGGSGLFKKRLGPTDIKII